jgi:hypothetical protein
MYRKGVRRRRRWKEGTRVEWSRAEGKGGRRRMSFVGDRSLKPNADGSPSFAVEILTLHFINKAYYVSVWFL